MGKTLSRYKILILVIILIAAAAAGISIYNSNRTALLDKEAYSEMRTAIEDVGESEEGGFADQQALSDFIKQWADSHSLEYKEDKHGNIIFDKPATGRKKNFFYIGCIAVNLTVYRISEFAVYAAVHKIECGRIGTDIGKKISDGFPVFQIEYCLIFPHNGFARYALGFQKIRQCFAFRITAHRQFKMISFLRIGHRSAPAEKGTDEMRHARRTFCALFISGYLFGTRLGSNIRLKQCGRIVKRMHTAFFLDWNFCQ